MIDTGLMVTSSGLALLSVVAARAGISMPACLVIVMLAPAITVVATEMRRASAAYEVDAESGGA